MTQPTVSEKTVETIYCYTGSQAVAGTAWSGRNSQSWIWLLDKVSVIVKNKLFPSFTTLSQTFVVEYRCVCILFTVFFHRRQSGLCMDSLITKGVHGPCASTSLTVESVLLSVRGWCRSERIKERRGRQVAHGVVSVTQLDTTSQRVDDIDRQQSTRRRGTDWFNHGLRRPPASTATAAAAPSEAQTD